MKCCLCKEKEFSVIVEYTNNPSDTPNLICDPCLLELFEPDMSLEDRAINSIRGKRCK